MNLLGKRLHWTGAGLVFLITHLAYLKTMTITCPFWDSGEFIATSYIMGIPHPPGTPLYVVIGRLFSMLPIFPMVATRVNYISVLAGSLGAVFMYLFTVELWRRWGWPRMRTARTAGAGGSAGSAGSASADAAGPAAGFPADGDDAEETWQRWAGFFAGLVAALFVAFSPTYWDNSIEAEVYSIAALIMAMSAWLIMRWSRASASSQEKTGFFILLYYLICLSMGIALSAFLILPGIMLFAFLEDRRFFGDSFLGAALVASVTLLLHPGMLPTLGLWIYVPLFALVLLAVIFMGRKWSLVSGRGLLTWCLIVSVLGLSTHFYLTIRALYHNPAINEADPQTWNALWKVLTRDQYKPPNPFLVRKAPWAVQFGKHFWEYTKGQYSLGLRPSWLGNAIPLLLGVLGGFFQWKRDRKGFALLASSLFLMTVALVFYLNFATDEVRERDYFFAAAYQFYPVWIGLGVATLLGILRQGERSPAAGLRITLGAGVVAACLPLLTMNRYWFEHDRTKFQVARDFAYNMLVPLKPDAIIFTNGDNDTFPLWYLQEVEHVRKDVRVANLSLLNTDWYIRQLRDFAPKVDFAWNDEQISNAAVFTGYELALKEGYIDKADLDRFVRLTGLKPYVRTMDEPLSTKDVAVARIVEREYGKRPLYVAQTVPDLMGLENRLVQEGIVYEIMDPGDVPQRVDLPQTVHNLTQVYHYASILNPDGTHDDSVYKDENAMRLVQNYSAAYIAAAEEYRQENQPEKSMEMLGKAEALSPNSAPVLYSMALIQMDMGRDDQAEQLLRTLSDRHLADSRLYRLLGRLQAKQGHVDEATESYRLAVSMQPNQFDAARELFFLLWDMKQDRRAALKVLDDWLVRHPDDKQVRRAYQLYADSARILGQAP